MKIAIDLHNCTAQYCKLEQNKLDTLETNDYFRAMKSKENKKLLECQINKCRHNAILQLTNLKKLYKKSKKACAYVDKLLLNPEKITLKQYVQAVTNFYSV